MTNENFTSILAQRVMGWRVSPDRFHTGERGWLPRWKFQPTQKLTDAIRLLETAAPQEYSVTTDPKGVFCVKVKIGGITAQARDRSQALAICLAVANALGITVDSTRANL